MRMKWIAQTGYVKWMGLYWYGVPMVVRVLREIFWQFGWYDSCPHPTDDFEMFIVVGPVLYVSFRGGGYRNCGCVALWKMMATYWHNAMVHLREIEEIERHGDQWFIENRMTGRQKNNTCTGCNNGTQHLHERRPQKRQRQSV